MQVKTLLVLHINNYSRISVDLGRKTYVSSPVAENKRIR